MLSIFHPLVVGLIWLGVLAVAGTLAVAGLVVDADRRRSRPPAAAVPLRPRLREAA